MKLYREGTLLRSRSGNLWMITEITKKVWGKPPAQLTYTEVRLKDSYITHSLCRVVHYHISVNTTELVSET